MWIGVDFDRTLAYRDDMMPWTQLGAPLLPMVSRVRRWLAEGKKVKIFTARVAEGASPDIPYMRQLLAAWSLEYIGQALESTCIKDQYCLEIWDDKVIQVAKNTGEPMYKEAMKVDWAPPNPRADKPNFCKCGAHAKDPVCNCALFV